MKKIKIKVNGKIKSLNENNNLLNLINSLKIPIKKVAIELNEEIVDKRKLRKITLKKNDKIEIVHFIGGG
jgi:thiamine biosynthesis protein ThiS|tara:strand:+ start:88 stop:297 length:210 start_codon:yes stop_codon:yes gene_type:complete